MKRTSKTETANNAQATAKNYPELPLFDKVVKIDTEKGSRYQLGTGVYIDIMDGEESDYGCLNLYGVVIRTTYREIKKGAKAGAIFVSYPQYKAKDGTYKDHVTNYSKSLNAKIGEALKMHYDAFISADGEELPFN